MTNRQSGVLFGWMLLVATTVLLPVPPFWLAVPIIVVKNVLYPVYIVQMFIKDAHSTPRGWFKPWLFGLFFLLINVVCLVNPFMSDTDASAKGNTVYVTHDRTCKFCNKASYEVVAASITYSLYNGRDIQFVDLQKDTPLSRSVKKQIRYKGSILYENDALPYTKVENKQPATTPVSYCFDVFRELTNTQVVKVFFW